MTPIYICQEKQKIKGKCVLDSLQFECFECVGFDPLCERYKPVSKGLEEFGEESQLGYFEIHGDI